MNTGRRMNSERRRDRLSWLAALVLGTGLGGQCPAAAQPPEREESRFPNAPFREEVLTIAGDPDRPVMLQVTLFTPAGPGPFPLAVLNHGATNASAKNRGERYRFTIPAYYFMSRGYAVALPMMRGFAGSGGTLVTSGCNLVALAQSNARDIRAVLGALQARPDIDRSRVVIAGQSYGGWNTLGSGASAPPGVRALVTFNAAIRSSDCPPAAQDSSMATGAAVLGAGTSLPALLFWGQNDSIMPVAAWRGLYNSYKRANPRAELVDLGPYGTDSHQFLSDPGSLPAWAPPLDAFLARAGLPASIVHAQYLPRPVPAATAYAALTNVAAVPLSPDGRALYTKFLAGPQPRAFVIGPGGAVGAAYGGYDPLGTALRGCGRLTSGCQPYAVNDRVVWTGLPAMRIVNQVVRMDTPTMLATFYAVNLDCSARGVPDIAISMQPVHGSAMVSPHAAHPAFPPGPYAVCNGTAVPAVGVRYTPGPGYSGGDSLTLDQVDTEGRRQSIRVALTVR